MYQACYEGRLQWPIYAVEVCGRLDVPTLIRWDNVVAVWPICAVEVCYLTRYTVGTRAASVGG